MLFVLSLTQMLQDRPPGDLPMDPDLSTPEDGILTPEQYNDTLEYRSIALSFLVTSKSIVYRG